MASIEFLVRHTRYAIRLAIRSPGPTISMLLVLGLGIGAIASVLSLIGEVLLGPPRFADPARLFTLTRGLSVPNALDLRKHVPALEHLALADIGGDFSLTGVSQPRNLFGAAVTADFFKTLGVAPARGRDFIADEELEGRHDVAILTSGLWRRAFDGDPSIVGRVVRLNDRPVRVIGVMPPDFRFGDVEIFRPLVIASFHDRRGRHEHMAVARLKADVTVAQANGSAKALAAQLAREYPRENAGLEFSLQPLDDGVAKRTRGPLLMLLTAAVLVFLIVSVNVASLLLARGVSRRREFAVRTALGGGSGRLTGQLAIECTLLFMAAALLGLLAAFASRGVLMTMAAPYFGPLFEPRLDWRVIACGVSLAAIAGLLCALAPALQARRAGVYDVLKEDSQAVMGGRTSRRFSHAFVVAQIALAFILLAGAGLMLRSLAHLQQVPLGFATADASITTTRLPASQYPAAERKTVFAAQLLDRAQRLPGVMAAGITTDAPLRGASGTRFVIDGQPRPPAGKQLDARIVAVSPDYFRSLEVPVRRGRAFATSDAAQAPPVAIVSDTLANTYFAGVDPIGQRIRLENAPDVSLEIVGVVADIRQRSVTREPWPMVYRPFAQAPHGDVTLIVRTRSAGAAGQAFVGQQLRETLNRLNPALVWTPVLPMSDYIGSDAALVQRHFVMRLLGLFAAIALIVAVLGIHGTLSYAVAQRTREIGLRIALGATAAVVVREMLQRTLMLTAIGLVCGMAGALLWGRLLGTLLYGVSALDGVTYAAVSGLFVAAALAASYWPARRASRSDPIQALRTP
jgi:putative ABC transport system permease protein